MDGALLRRARLQGAWLIGARLRRANLTEARLQGELGIGSLQGAFLNKARLHDAHVGQLQGAHLYQTRLATAWLSHANLQGALLDGTEFPVPIFDIAKPLTVRAAGIRRLDCRKYPWILEHLDVVFADGTVTLPKRIDWPSHWWPEELDILVFHEKWRAWQATLPPESTAE